MCFEVNLLLLPQMWHTERFRKRVSLRGISGDTGTAYPGVQESRICRHLRYYMSHTVIESATSAACYHLCLTEQGVPVLLRSAPGTVQNRLAMYVFLSASSFNWAGMKLGTYSQVSVPGTIQIRYDSMHLGCTAHCDCMPSDVA